MNKAIVLAGFAVVATTIVCGDGVTPTNTPFPSVMAKLPFLDQPRELQLVWRLSSMAVLAGMAGLCLRPH
jgi:hypothetical protein